MTILDARTTNLDIQKYLERGCGEGVACWGSYFCGLKLDFFPSPYHTNVKVIIILCQNNANVEFNSIHSFLVKP